MTLDISCKHHLSFVFFSNHRQEFRNIHFTTNKPLLGSGASSGLLDEDFWRTLRRKRFPLSWRWKVLIAFPAGKALGLEELRGLGPKKFVYALGAM